LAISYLRRSTSRTTIAHPANLVLQLLQAAIELLQSFDQIGRELAHFWSRPGRTWRFLAIGQRRSVLTRPAKSTAEAATATTETAATTSDLRHLCSSRGAASTTTAASDSNLR
jgi:hypothetical protein